MVKIYSSTCRDHRAEVSNLDLRCCHVLSKIIVPWSSIVHGDDLTIVCVEEIITKL